MFTGIVEELGTVRACVPATAAGPLAGGTRIEISANHVLADAELGASIAVNGCCLTVVELSREEGSAHWFAADVVPETLARTSLGGVAVGDRANLERPVRLVDRLGGHLVQGHVDGVGVLQARDPEADGSIRISFSAPEPMMRHVVEKGSIAVDGISLTVAALGRESFEVAVIPHTLATTTLGSKQPGELVNLETDVLAKYVERLMTVTIAR
ncbi:MAG TPA: riboflavin synthase [Acidimicrobiia bacterium]